MATAKRTVVPRFRIDRGKWEFDYRDRNGRRHRPLFATEGEALERASNVAEELRRGGPAVDDPDLTLANYTTRWLEGAAQEVEPKTLDSYRDLLMRHVLPTLGFLRLRDLAAER